jgi:hypothetical protein
LGEIAARGVNARRFGYSSSVPPSARGSTSCTVAYTDAHAFARQRRGVAWNTDRMELRQDIFR